MPTITIPYEPRRVQRALHNSLKRWNVLVIHRRFGKALDLDTPVPMADGSWKTIGTVEEGDLLIGRDGKPTAILMVHPIMRDRPCFELEFASGDRIVADEGHLWTTTRKKDRHNYDSGLLEGKRKNRPRPAEPRTTREIFETLEARGEFNHRIPIVRPVEHPEADLPIDPYLLGVWLGDGTSRAPHVTTMDSEIVRALVEACDKKGWQLGLTKHQNAGKALTYKVIGGLQSLLRENDLLNNKHIPEAYFSASIEQRKRLLAGLMDTDGSINKKGSFCEFTNKNKSLVDGLERILLSLGMVPSRSVKIVGDGEYYRLSFRPTFACFEIERKSSRFSTCPESKRWQSIVGAVPVESRPVRCLTVDAEDGLFCVGRRYTLTHNTVFAINHLIREALLCQKHRPRFGYMAPYLKQAKDIAWDYLKYYTKDIPGMSTNENELRVDLPNGGRVRLYGCDNPQAMRGIYLDGCVMDEYAQMDDALLGETVLPTLVDRDGWLVMMGTPKGAENGFHERFLQAQAKPDLWYSIVLDATQTDTLTPQQLEAIKAITPRETFEQEFMCSWSAAVRGSYFLDQMEALRANNQIADVPYNPFISVDTWWDLGLHDQTSIIFTQDNGREIHVIDYLEDSDHGLDFYVDELQARKEKLKYHYGTHTGPWDLVVREFGSGGRSRLETALALGIRFEVAPKVARKEDGINAIRTILPTCWIDRQKCGRLVACLDNYKKVWDDKLKRYRDKPEHDQYSHGVDAFQTLATKHKFGRKKRDSADVVRKVTAAGWT